MQYSFSVKNYSLEKTLLSGQVFRWNMVGDIYRGVVDDSYVELTCDKDNIIANVISGDCSEARLKEYLDVDFNYEKLLSDIYKDEIVTSSIDKFLGYRILIQEPFETLISFVCSTNSNIPNTRAKVQNLSKMFGKKIYGEYYQFPRPEELAQLTEKEIMKAKVGYRGKYIIETSKMLLENDILSDIVGMEDEDAIKSLTSLPGVGNKVADCVLLFAYHRLNRVPVDVWMKRIFVNLYGRDEESKYDDLESFCERKFGEYAGYFSHFLFEHARSGGLV